MRPRNNLPPKNHWTGPQRGLKLVNNKAARFAIAAFSGPSLPGLSETFVQMTLIEQLRSKKNALTVEDLAGLLCIAVRTVYKEVEDDHIPFFRVRSSIRFDPHQIADWLEMKMPAHSVRGERRHDESIAHA
jgi:excisionase family DNA binding protein